LSEYHKHKPLPLFGRNGDPNELRTVAGGNYSGAWYIGTWIENELYKRFENSPKCLKITIVGNTVPATISIVGLFFCFLLFLTAATMGSFSRYKMARTLTHYSTPSRAEVKNGETLSPHMSKLHCAWLIKHKDNLAFTLNILNLPLRHLIWAEIIRF
jgi:hypothetical protein